MPFMYKTERVRMTLCNLRVYLDPEQRVRAWKVLIAKDEKHGSYNEACKILTRVEPRPP